MNEFRFTSIKYSVIMDSNSNMKGIRRQRANVDYNRDEKWSTAKDIFQLSKEEIDQLYKKVRTLLYDYAYEQAMLYISELKTHLTTVPKNLHEKFLLKEYDDAYNTYLTIPLKREYGWKVVVRAVSERSYKLYKKDELTARQMLTENAMGVLAKFMQNKIEREILTDAINNPDSLFSENTGMVNQAENENPTPKEIINPFPRIFVNATTYILFDKLQKKITKNELAEYSFLYWAMVNDDYILKSCRPSEFREWLSSEYEIELTELKQYDKCKGGNKIQIYELAKSFYDL